jgi:hypothetical protein
MWPCATTAPGRRNGRQSQDRAGSWSLVPSRSTLQLIQPQLIQPFLMRSAVSCADKGSSFAWCSNQLVKAAYVIGGGLYHRDRRPGGVQAARDKGRRDRLDSLATGDMEAKSARSGAPPVCFSPKFKDKPAVSSYVNVGHPAGVKQKTERVFKKPAWLICHRIGAYFLFSAFRYLRHSSR